MMPGGYWNAILRVDLDRGAHWITSTGEALARGYIGGRGFAARLLYDELVPGTDPFGPDNPVVVAPGPMTGVFMPNTGKVTFAARSPATGLYGDSNMGGHFGLAVRMAGYDALVIRGRASEPSVLVIDDGRVRLLPAGDLWGLGSFDAEVRLKEKLGEDFQVAVIGPAGENRVVFACISHDFGRQAGRTGVGAVLGSKNIKAIAVRGTRSLPVANPRRVMQVGQRLFRHIFSLPGTASWTPYGTAGVTTLINEVGALPTENFRRGTHDHWQELTGETLRRRILVRDKGCTACAIPCGKYSRARLDGTERYVEGPEYESMALLGSNLGMARLEEVAHLNWLCDQLGLDAISAGAVASFAVEAFERGLITRQDTDGRKLAFGDYESLAWLMEQIAYRRGVGDLLAGGVRHAAQALGGGSDAYAIHVKGLEVSGYEPRNTLAMLLSYMTCDIGAHHNRAWAILHDIEVGRYKVEGKAEKVIELQHLRPVYDMLCVCRFPWIEVGFGTEHYAEMLSAVTGEPVTWEHLTHLAERVWNITRLMAIRDRPGFGRADDLPPRRFYEEPVEGGPAHGHHADLADIQRLLDRYYQLRGWDENGHPKPETLERLEIGPPAFARRPAGAG